MRTRRPFSRPTYPELVIAVICCGPGLAYLAWLVDVIITHWH